MHVVVLFLSHRGRGRFRLRRFRRVLLAVRVPRAEQALQQSLAGAFFGFFDLRQGLALQAAQLAEQESLAKRLSGLRTSRGSGSA